MTGDTTAIARWRARMGLTQRAAAESLGIALKVYQEHERGASFAGAARDLSPVLALACAAVEHAIEPIG